MSEENKNEQKVVYSAIQPSGTFTLGNLLGALQNWVKLQDEHKTIFTIADLHAITVKQKPADLRKNTYEGFALLMALGIDCNKSTIFVQSHVSAHAELAWMLNCHTGFGELSRMTQFKDKSQKHQDNINAGLFTYPSLMAADILLYQTDLVPVGADQKQHLELTRDLAIRFNSTYSDTFTLPEPYILKEGSRVMSLQDPTKKMSKSDDNENAYILLLDNIDAITRKIKRAVTDSEGSIRTGEGKEAVENLLTIFSAVTNKSVDTIISEYDGKGYAVFKEDLAENLVNFLAPIQEKFNELMSDKAELENIMKQNAETAAKIAFKTLNKVKRKIGLVI